MPSNVAALGSPSIPDFAGAIATIRAALDMGHDVPRADEASLLAGIWRAFELENHSFADLAEGARHVEPLLSRLEVESRESTAGPTIARLAEFTQAILGRSRPPLPLDVAAMDARHVTRLLEGDDPQAAALAKMRALMGRSGASAIAPPPAMAGLPGERANMSHYADLLEALDGAKGAAYYVLRVVAPRHLKSVEAKLASFDVDDRDLLFHALDGAVGNVDVIALYERELGASQDESERERLATYLERVKPS